MGARWPPRAGVEMVWPAWEAWPASSSPPPPAHASLAVLPLAALLFGASFGALVARIAATQGTASSIGEVVAGVVLGPAGLALVSAGHIESELLTHVGTIGVCLLFFEAGMRLDLQVISERFFQAAAAAVIAAALPALVVFVLLHRGLCLGLADSTLGCMVILPACSRVSNSLVHKAQRSGYAVERDIPAVAFFMDVLALNALACANNLEMGARPDFGAGQMDQARRLNEASRDSGLDLVTRRRLLQTVSLNSTNATAISSYTATWASFATTAPTEIGTETSTPSPSPQYSACTLITVLGRDTLHVSEDWWPAVQPLVVLVLMTNVALALRQLARCLWGDERSSRWWTRFRPIVFRHKPRQATAKPADKVAEEVLVCQECDDNTEPSHLCEDCGLLFCDDCCKHHRRSRRSKAHVLKPLAEIRGIRPLQFSDEAQREEECKSVGDSGHPDHLVFSVRSPSTSPSLHVGASNFGGSVKTSKDGRRNDQRNRILAQWDLSDSDSSDDTTPMQARNPAQETLTWRLSDSSDSDAEIPASRQGDSKPSTPQSGLDGARDVAAADACAPDSRNSLRGVTGVLKKSGETSLMRWEREMKRRGEREKKHRSMNAEFSVEERDIKSMPELSTPDTRHIKNNDVGESFREETLGEDRLDEKSELDGKVKEEAKLPAYADAKLLQSVDESMLLSFMLGTLAAFATLAELFGSSFGIGALISGLAFGSSGYAVCVWGNCSNNVVAWAPRIFFACTVGAGVARTPWLRSEAVLGGIYVFAAALTMRVVSSLCLAGCRSSDESKWIAAGKAALSGFACSGRDEVAYWMLLQLFGAGRLSVEALAILLWATAISTLLCPLLFIGLLKRLAESEKDNKTFGVGIIWIKNGVLAERGDAGRMQLVVAGFTPKSYAGSCGVAAGDILVAFRRGDNLVDVIALLNDGASVDYGHGNEWGQLLNGPEGSLCEMHLLRSSLPNASSGAISPESLSPSIRPLAHDETYDVMIARDENGFLGLRFSQTHLGQADISSHGEADTLGYTISNLTPGGAAEKSKLISLGDLVVKIDGHTLSYLSMEAVNALARGPAHAPITMTMLGRRDRVAEPFQRSQHEHNASHEVGSATPGSVVVVHVPRMCSGRDLEGLVRLM